MIELLLVSTFAIIGAIFFCHHRQMKAIGPRQRYNITLDEFMRLVKGTTGWGLYESKDDMNRFCRIDRVDPNIYCHVRGNDERWIVVDVNRMSGSTDYEPNADGMIPTRGIYHAVHVYEQDSIVMRGEGDIITVTSHTGFTFRFIPPDKMTSYERHLVAAEVLV